jgi:two-component system, OmpR family, sensor kinase
VSSLKRRLTLWLWGALILVGAGSAALAYFVAGREASRTLDYQLQQIARLMLARGPDQASAPVNLDATPGIAHDYDDEILVWINDDAGRRLFASQLRVPAPSRWDAGFQDTDLAGRSYRLFAATTPARQVLVAQEAESRREVATGAGYAALLPLVILLPLLATLIAFVIRAAFAPIRSATDEIAARPPFALNALSTQGLPAEIRPLVDEINRLLARLEDAIQHEQQFLADAAHALRTPLAALQLQADVLDRAHDPEDHRARLGELRAGVRRVSRLAAQLLTLAGNKVEHQAASKVTALDAEIRAASALYASVAARQGVDMSVSGETDVSVTGPPGRVALLVGNLLDNALRYTPPGGRVRVNASQADTVASIEVIDEGPGLPQEELERVFERFYRAPGDPTEGGGLGLAVVRSVAHSMGGTASLANRRDRSGLIARVSLPIVQGAMHRPALREGEA